VGVVGTPDELFVLFAGLRWSFEISIKSQGDTSPYRKLYQHKQEKAKKNKPKKSSIVP